MSSSSPEVFDYEDEPDSRIRPNVNYYDLFDQEEEEEDHNEWLHRYEDKKRETRRKLFHEKQVTKEDDDFPPTQVVPSPIKIKLHDF